jgi:predicted AAA+ superfamily ATPase
MAHVRKRHLHARFEKLCKFSPLVGVFGHRQTGKTTFTEKNSSHYITFDQLEHQQAAEQNPSRFLKEIHSKRTVIDECQIVPQIFPALKEWVRVNQRPGQFVLTGSVKFTSRMGVRESLTGRIGTSELLPLTIAELLEKELSDSILRLIVARDFLQLDLSVFHSSHYSSEKKFMQVYLAQGGLPGICFVRDLKIRNDYLDTLLNLMLDFDLRQVVKTNLSLRTIKNLLEFIARSCLKPYSYAEVKRELKLSEVTQKKILHALESIYVLRRFKIDGAKGELFFLEDQFEEYRLSGGQLEKSAQIITALYRNIRAQFVYRSGDSVEFFQYRTRGGAFVPLALKTDSGVLGMMAIQNSKPALSEKRSAESFLRRYPQGKILFLSESVKEAKALTSNQLVLSPFSLL